MQSQVSEISPVLVEVKVEVPWDHVEEHLDAEFKKVGKKARVRGFRPGKAPLSVVKKVYGPQVEAEVASQLIQEGLNRAVEEHQIALVARPELEELGKVSAGEPFVFRAKIEVRPKIEKVVVDGIDRAAVHNGGRIAFGPDGTLYAGTGDAGRPELAQDTDSLAGKILRMTPDGAPVADAPFGNLVHSYGHRNVQGLAWVDFLPTAEAGGFQPVTGSGFLFHRAAPPRKTPGPVLPALRRRFTSPPARRRGCYVRR